MYDMEYLGRSRVKVCKEFLWSLSLSMSAEVGY